MPIWLPNSYRDGWDLWTIGWGIGSSTATPLTVSVEDSFILTDNLELFGAFYANLSDGLDLQDAQEYFLTHNLDVYDEYSISDAIDLGLSVSAEVSSSFTLTDSLSLFAAFYSSLSDTITLSDNISSLLGETPQISVDDTLAFSDAISTAFTELLQITAEGTFVEWLDEVLVDDTGDSPFDLDFSDALSFDFALEMRLHWRPLFTDILTFQDKLIVEAPFTNTTFTDSVTLTDEVEIVLGVEGIELTVSVSDAFSLTDYIYRRYSRTMDDYYRRHLNDRVIQTNNELAWFNDELALEDEVTLILS